jgi:predicted phage terminase large subunit-like protein
LWVRYWDKAASKKPEADFSAGVRMLKSDLGVYYVEDVTRGQWSSLDRNKVMRNTAKQDGPAVTVWLEEEGGSGGKESAEISVRDLAGVSVHAERVTGDKLSRARPFSAQCEAGNVKIVRGAWNAAYLDELHAFPLGAHDDQVDASSGAFNKLANLFTDAWDPTPHPAARGVMADVPEGVFLD